MDLRNQSPLSIYMEYCKQGKLAYQVDESGNAVFFPRVIAPVTAESLEWKISKGIGTVYSTTVVYYKSEPPLNVALIDLDEGFRMMSRVEGVDAMKVEVGMKVKVKMTTNNENGTSYLVFEPLDQ